MKKQFLAIDGILVNRELMEVKFACDLSKCKGACCTLESDFGAPLAEKEIPEMENALGAAMKYLPEEHRKEIEKGGFYETKSGELLTRSFQRRACLLAYFEDGIAKCALEKAYFNGETKFRKPVSCHLFPIRVADFGGEILRYERFAECQPALEQGKEKQISIAEFCRESLIRKYSKGWYEKLVNSDE